MRFSPKSSVHPWDRTKLSGDEFALVLKYSPILTFFCPTNCKDVSLQQFCIYWTLEPHRAVSMVIPVDFCLVNGYRWWHSHHWWWYSFYISDFIWKSSAFKLEYKQVTTCRRHHAIRQSNFVHKSQLKEYFLVLTPLLPPLSAAPQCVTHLHHPHQNQNW